MDETLKIMVGTVIVFWLFPVLSAMRLAKSRRRGDMPWVIAITATYFLGIALWILAPSISFPCYLAAWGIVYVLYMLPSVHYSRAKQLHRKALGLVHGRPYLYMFLQMTPPQKDPQEASDRDSKAEGLLKDVLILLHDHGKMVHPITREVAICLAELCKDLGKEKEASEYYALVRNIEAECPAFRPGDRHRVYGGWRGWLASLLTWARLRS